MSGCAADVISKRSFNDALAAGNFTAVNITAFCDTNYKADILEEYGSMVIL